MWSSGKWLIGSLAVVLLAATGCASSVHIRVTDTFPTVLAEPEDIHAAVVFTEEFRTFQASPNAEISIDIGAAQVDLLGKAFRGLFRRLDVIAAGEQAPTGSELVITPSVREVQVSTPSDSYLNVYEVWIRYNLEIETADGQPIDSWFMPAYGKTPDSLMLSRTRAIEEAAVVALRDAGAKLLLDFYRIPSVYGWMEQRTIEARK